MVYSQSNLVYAEKVSQNSRAYGNFLRPLHNKTTKLDYVYWFRIFMRWCAESEYVSHQEDFEALLSLNSDGITDLLLDWIDYEKKKGNKGSSMNIDKEVYGFGFLFLIYFDYTNFNEKLNSLNK